MNALSEVAAPGPAIAAGPKRHACYVVRHWRGELPIRTSYWLNGVLLSILVAVVVRAANVLDTPLLFVSLGVAMAAVRVWQLVGIWRATGRGIASRRERGQSWGRPVVYRFLTVGRACWLGYIAVSMAPSTWENLKRADLGDPTPHHVVRLLNQGREIAITGGFDQGTAADFETLLAASPAVRTVDLNSLGGRVFEGRQMAKLIKARGLATYTGVICASACTIAYMGGNPRYLAVRAKLGFHRFSVAGLGGWLSYAVNTWGEQEMVQSGVTAQFAAQVFATPNSGAWLPDTDTLIAGHVVTQVVNGMAFSMHAGGGMRSTDDFVAGVEKLADFAALRRAEPATYSRIVADMRAAAQGDVTVQDVYAPARASLAGAVAKYRPLADDRTQVQFATLAADEGEMLSRDHPDACLKALDRSHPFWGYASLLTYAVTQREAALGGRIIDTGAAVLGGALAVSQPTDQALAAEEALVWSHVRIAGYGAGTADDASNSLFIQRERCLTQTSFMRNLAALPVARAGALMRYLERGR